MPDIVYLTLEEVVAIHHDQIESYGGSHGIRDLNLLLSALVRPASSFGGEDLYQDVFSKAAVLLHSLVLNHAFVDGNKRTAIVSSARFLFVNGYVFTVANEDVVTFVLKIALKEITIEKVADWLKKHSARI